MIYGRRKFGNKKVEIDGHVFDSKKESRRYAELRLLEKAGEISGLQTQVPFVLIPAQKDEKGRVIERAASYVADFVYNSKDGRLIVEDTKSPATRTDVYRLKKKLMLKVHGIRIYET